MTTPTPSSVEAMREALTRIRTSMVMLQQHSEGCAANHYGDDCALHGMPGWLCDTRADLDAFTVLLSTLTPDDGVTIPADYVLVPREPTEEMRDAYRDGIEYEWLSPDAYHLQDDGYAAMLSAAPKAPPVSQPEGVQGLRERLEAWRLRDGYVPAYVAGWNAMLDQALAALFPSGATEQGDGE